MILTLILASSLCVVDNRRKNCGKNLTHNSYRELDRMAHNILLQDFRELVPRNVATGQKVMRGR